MTRQEFMRNLEKLLWDISESERAEALQYYNDYFDDAGEENEEAVLRELGSPIQVAKKIKAGFSEEASEYSEQGYEDTRFRDAMEMIVEEEKQNWKEAEQEEAKTASKRKKGPANGWKILAIILLCLFVLPILLPVGVALVATILGLAAGLAAVIISIGIAGISVFVSGVVYIFVGIIRLFTLPAVGLAMAGTGCILFAAGLLISWIIFRGAIKFIPWLIRGIVKLLQRPFRKAGVSL
ncbi:MAG: DUF1700 domain-containing protein [Lachnospiraceae bacterium]|nr:DUF1700 domain-containing protein [Lachnospiraceae bacterium]